MKVLKSIGPDEVNLWVLRELVNDIDKLISVIFEILRQSGEVPSDWKRGNNPHF